MRTYLSTLLLLSIGACVRSQLYANCKRLSDLTESREDLLKAYFESEGINTDNLYALDSLVTKIRASQIQGIPIDLSFCRYFNGEDPVMTVLEYCDSGTGLDYTCGTWAMYEKKSGGFSPCASAEICDKTAASPHFSVNCQGQEENFPDCAMTCAGYDNLDSSGIQTCTNVVAGGCQGLGSFNTTYGNADVTPYYGVFFSLRAKDDPIDILTFELDVVASAEWVEFEADVYTVLGDYEVAATDPSLWTKVSTAMLVQNPSGSGAIIPMNNFFPVQMDAKELRSFFISMKGPYLNYKPVIAGSTDNVAFGTRDLDVYTANGARSYYFPTNGLDPSAIGNLPATVYFANKNSCDREEFVSTTVSYEFTIDIYNPDVQIESTIYDGINVIIEMQLRADTAILNGFRKINSLTKKSISVTSQEPSRGTIR
jgi:hypothetical protein